MLLPMPHHPPSKQNRTRHVARTLIACPASFVAATALAGELTIEVSGIASNKGKVYVALYDHAEAFPIAGRQLVGQILDPSAPHLTVHFKEVPAGRYAAVAFQDENGNGKLDKNFLGIPKEPYGFSNGARGAAGPPKFTDAAVMLNPDGTMRIELK
jgi:uncharacterized protein (DUF2141 family)